MNGLIGFIGKVKVFRRYFIGEWKLLLSFKIRDDMIWLGLWYNGRYRVNYVLGVGWFLRFIIFLGNNIGF